MNPLRSPQKNKWVFAVVCIAALMGSRPRASEAQYQVFAWDNFENGVFPPQLARRHHGDEGNIGIFDFTSAEAPKGILDGRAKNECGRYGVFFRTSPKNNILSVVNPLALDRKLLGQTGRALYQADLFIPEENSDNANIAVLAVPVAINKSSEWLFYRIGLRGGSGKRVYFSYTTGGESPKLAFDQPTTELFKQRPGWHRFQIIFQGQETIHCAVDGKMTKFSPFAEASQTILRAGIMTAARADQTAICYADNLSIQWTPDDVPLPDSPWADSSDEGAAGAAPSAKPNSAAAAPPSANSSHGEKATASAAQPGVAGAAAGAPGNTSFSAGAPAAAAPNSGLWFASIDDARQAAINQRRPMLILFQAPKARAQQTLNPLLASPEAESFLKPFACVRVDVNQLAGGAMAQRLSVIRVPCFVVYNSGGAEAARFVYTYNMDLKAIKDALQPALPASSGPPVSAYPPAPGANTQTNR